MSNTPTPCSECGKTHPWLSCVTPATATGLTTPTELPEDIKKEIRNDAHRAADLEEDRLTKKQWEYLRKVSRVDGYVCGYIAGATAYAPHKVEAERAKKLLERWINVHNLGILPSEQLIDEIKTFLDGKA
jgi:hypothetical protein